MGRNFSIERDRRKKKSNLWYQTTRDIFFFEYVSQWEEKKACSMIYAQLLTNSSSLKRALKKKENMNPGLTTNQFRSYGQPSAKERTKGNLFELD